MPDLSKIISPCGSDDVKSAHECTKKSLSADFAGRDPSCIEMFLFLVQLQVELYGDGYGGTYHRVVADTEEAHHLNVGRYG